MKSGLEDRNNMSRNANGVDFQMVSMKSGLEDRNNLKNRANRNASLIRLNEVRPGRPEQCVAPQNVLTNLIVSMKSGLEDRNN